MVVGIVSPPPSGASRRPAVPSPDDQQRRARAARLAAEVGDADDRELEALGAVDRHQAHGVQALGLERGLALARLGEVAGLGVGEEAAQVAALGALVLARQPHQLAQVREPAVAAGAGERRRGRSRWRRSRARAAPPAARAGRARARRPAGARPRLSGRLDGVPQAAAGVAVLGRGARARPCPRRGRARRGRSAAPPRRAGWRARAARRGRRGPAPGSSSRGRRPRTSAGPAPRAPPRAAAGDDGRADEHDHVAGAPAAVELGAQAVGDQPRLGAPPGLVSPLRQAEPRRQLVPPLRAGDEQLDGRLALRRADVEQPQRPVLVDR